MAKKRRRKLRKRVYVLLIIILCILIGLGVFLLKKKTSKQYQFYQGEVSEVEMSLKADGYLYTYKQQYFTDNEYQYLSLNDLYNVFIHINNGKMTLNQKKDTMTFENDAINVVLNYKKEVMTFKDCMWSEATNGYLTGVNALNELSLTEVGGHSYIYEGEVFIRKDLVEMVLLNSGYTFDLTQQKVNEVE